MYKPLVEYPLTGASLTFIVCLFCFMIALPLTRQRDQYSILHYVTLPLCLAGNEEVPASIVIYCQDHHRPKNARVIGDTDQLLDHFTR